MDDPNIKVGTHKINEKTSSIEMDIKTKYIKSNGESENIYPLNYSNFTTQELQMYVGGYIEIVPIGQFLLIVNEEGKLNGLPYNKRATELIRLISNDYVAGDVVYCEKELVK